jgi:hypothetical protein
MDYKKIFKNDKIDTRVSFIILNNDGFFPDEFNDTKNIVEIRIVDSQQEFELYYKVDDRIYLIARSSNDGAMNLSTEYTDRNSNVEKNFLPLYNACVNEYTVTLNKNACVFTPNLFSGRFYVVRKNQGIFNWVFETLGIYDPPTFKITRIEERDS